MIVSLELAPELGNDLDLWQEKEITTGNRQPLQLGEQPPASETCGGSGGSAARRHGSAAVHMRPVSLALLRPMDRPATTGNCPQLPEGRGGAEGVCHLQVSILKLPCAQAGGRGGTC